MSNSAARQQQSLLGLPSHWSGGDCFSDSGCRQL